MRITVIALIKGAATFAATFLSIAAFAGNSVADEKIAVAKASIQRAEQSGAPEYAPVELATARDKVVHAEKLNLDRETKSAAMLADQANLDAQVAEAIAQQQRAHKAAVEFDQGMQTLRQEATRSSPTTN